VTLTTAQIEQYDREGFLVFEELITPAEAAQLLDRLDAILRDERRPPGVVLQVEPALQRAGETDVPFVDSIRKVDGLAEHEPLYAALARDPRLIGILSDLLGPDIKLFRNSLMMKPAHHGSAKPYHQDSAYWSIDPPSLASCWLALDEATAENGCMRVLPGSHKQGILAHQHLADYQVDEETLDTANETSVPLGPGGCLIFHSMLLHATAPNASPRPRRSMILSCMSARSRWTGDPARKPAFPLLAGREYPGCV
jgi:ectoine hydroxylase-related dioxygenase (phytanoyl-CoA dioxygenase family)